MKTTTARHLKVGDVLAGSRFVVTHNAWSGVRTRKGYVIIEGYYPGGLHKRHEWNASTTVTIV